MLKEDKCFYEKKIIYLDYLERDTKVKNGGFIKWESKGETSRVQIHIRGLYPTDTLQGEIFIVSRSKTFAADSIALKFGTGEYAAIWKNEDLAGTKISYDECDGIQLRLSENRMLKGIWRERESLEEGPDELSELVEESKDEIETQEIVEQQENNEQEETDDELLRTVIESVKKDSVMPIHNDNRNEREESPTGAQGPSSMRNGMPSGIPRPSAVQENRPTGEQSPTSVRDGMPSGIPRPSAVQENRPTGEQSPMPVRDGMPSGIPRPSEVRENRPTGAQSPMPVRENIPDETDDSINDLTETAYKTLNGVGLEKVQPKWVQSKWKQPKQEQSKWGQSEQEQSKWDQPQQEQSRWNQPKQQQPKQEQPRWEQPRQEQPRQEQPRWEEPRQEQPRQEQPQQEQPRWEQPQQQQPKQEQSRWEQPQKEQPQQQQPKQELPKGGKTIKEHKPTQLSGDKWEQLCRQYPRIHPFGDDREYLSISPRDFVVLGRQYQNLVQNSFLLHGYYNYGHCILAKIMEKEEECFYLGVPGVYYDREKQAALMFGFEGFEAGTERTSEGGFGYYMKQVEI